MTTEFNKGDKVRIVSLGDFAELAEGDPAGAAQRGLVVGNTGTVTDGNEANVAGVVSVRTDNATMPHPQSFGREGWAFYPHELSKVES